MPSAARAPRCAASMASHRSISSALAQPTNGRPPIAIWISSLPFAPMRTAASQPGTSASRRNWSHSSGDLWTSLLRRRFGTHFFASASTRLGRVSMQRNARQLLYDIATSAEAIEGFTRGRTLQHYEDDLMLRSACERQFEIIGEAMTRLRDRHPDVFSNVSKGRAIIAFRNRLIHGYDSV